MNRPRALVPTPRTRDWAYRAFDTQAVFELCISSVRGVLPREEGV